MIRDRDKPVALLDLDGSLADYDSAMKQDLAKLRSEGEPEIDPTNSDADPAWLTARVRMIRNQPHWWEHLKPLELGTNIKDLLLFDGFSLNVLTKGPFSNSNAWSEKVRWCRNWLPQATVTITEDKSLVYGKVLYDDYPAYIEPWLERRPRGLVIMPDHPWNQGFSHPQVIRATLDNLDEVQVRIRSVLTAEQNKMIDAKIECLKWLGLDKRLET